MLSNKIFYSNKFYSNACNLFLKIKKKLNTVTCRMIKSPA